MITKGTKERCGLSAQGIGGPGRSGRTGAARSSESISRLKVNRSTMRRLVAALLLLALMAGSAGAEEWAFAVIGDNRSAFASYRNVLNEIRTQTASPGKAFPFPALVVACGDLDPVETNYTIFKEVFRDRMPSYFPVRGNHDSPADVRFVIREVLIPYGKGITRLDDASINYFADWKNTRLIVLDQYSPFGRSFESTLVLAWLESVLKAPDHIRHIFVAFHDPYLAEHPENDPFWSLLVKEKRVRAVFAAHTHTYQKRRFPDAVTGIYYVNAGNAGQSTHSDNQQTIVEILISGEQVTFRVIQAREGSTKFSIREEWKIKGQDGDRSQNELQSPPVSVKAGGYFAGHYAVH